MHRSREMSRPKDMTRHNHAVADGRSGSNRIGGLLEVDDVPESEGHAPFLIVALVNQETL